LIAITAERAGVLCKLATLKAFAPGGRFLLLDDNRQIGQEFAREGAAFIQIRQPSKEHSWFRGKICVECIGSTRGWPHQAISRFKKLLGVKLLRRFSQ